MGTWLLAGNALGKSPTGFLGTTDNNALVIKTGSPTVERLRVDTSGNVGIGTKTPAATLDIAAGTLHVNEPASPTTITTAVQGAYLAWNALTGSTGETDFINNQGLGSGGFAFMNTPPSGSPRTTLMVITGGGNVGIGTTAPNSQLHVNVAASPNPISALTIDVQSFETEPNAQASHFLLVHDIGAAPPSGATHFAIRGDGFIGIGTPQPSARLSIVLPNTSEIAGTARSNMLLTSSGAVGVAVNSQLALASFGFTVDGLNNVSLGVRAIRALPTPPLPQGWPSTALCLSRDVDNTPTAGAAIFLSANGNVGIGTSTPGYKLSVNGGATASTLYVSGGGQFDGNVGIALTRDDVERDGEPASPLVVRGDIRTIGNGNVNVSGDVLLKGADCAEDFDVTGPEPPGPGTVVVIDEEGALRESHEEYDKKAAGVVSGAGDYRHGIVLDQRPESEGRVAVALVGKVYCKVDANYSPINVGDLLTTSSTPGHAMKAGDPVKAFGSVIGKALRPLDRGQALIPILVALQ